MSSIITTEHFRRPVRFGGYYNQEANGMFGLAVFLLSESVIFFSFFTVYIVYKITAINWLPPGVTGLEIESPAVNTLVLVSSSGVIYLAEKYFKRQNLLGFRLFLIATMVMGSYFLIGQTIEWSHLEFSFTSGVFGGMFYLLTGFHGLHVLCGIVLQGIILSRSFIVGNYDISDFGVNATSLFWHFVDVIWVILFILLYLWQ